MMYTGHFQEHVARTLFAQLADALHVRRGGRWAGRGEKEGEGGGRRVNRRRGN